MTRGKGEELIFRFSQLETAASYSEADVRSFPPPQLPRPLLSTFIGNSACYYCVMGTEEHVDVLQYVGRERAVEGNTQVPMDLEQFEAISKLLKIVKVPSL